MASLCLSDLQRRDIMTAVAPWTILESETTFADPWLRVRSDRVRTGAGDVLGPYHVIEAPNWVTIVPLTPYNTVLLVREYRHGIGTVTVGLPGGLVDPADGSDRSSAAEGAAYRELLEETGATGRLERLSAIHPNPSNQNNTAFCFLATGVARSAAPQPDGLGEALDVVELDFVGLLDELREGVAAFHAVHSAALWAAAARIAADRSARFGSLTIQVRRFLVGEYPRCPTAIRAARAAAEASVAG